MIEYSQKVIEGARMMKCRFTLLQLRDQCRSHYGFTIYPLDTNAVIDGDKWYDLHTQIIKLLNSYDNGCKLNEDFLIKLYNIKVSNNPMVVSRLIKLINNI